MDKLPGVLWAYRTTARWPTGISPFALIYEIEAIVLTEISMPTLRTDLPKQLNVETMIKDLDEADELHEAVAVRIASYHNRLANLYNKRVKPRMFQSGDLVLRKVFENAVYIYIYIYIYIVTWPDESGSYALDKLDGTPVPRMWNAMHLKSYYQ